MAATRRVHFCPNTAFHPIATALALLLAGAGAGMPARAQTPAAAPQAAARDWNLPAAPLADTLARIAREGGRSISADPALLAGRQAPAVQGRFNVEEAAQRALAGSGLALARTPSGTLTLVAGAAAAPAAPLERPAAATATGGTLAAVTVTAQAVEDGRTEGTGSYTTRSTSAATGMNLSLRETPQSVTVITRQRMDEQGLNSLLEVMNQVAGVHSTVGGTGLGGWATLRARGYDIDSYQIDGLGMFIDGYSAATLDSAIYDSVTVVRGAKGLLTGAGDPGGSVHLTRKRPTHEFQASLSQSLGRWGKRRTMGDVAGPLNQAGTLRGRLVAAHDKEESWIDRYSANQSVAYGMLETDLGDKTLLTLALEHGRSAGRSAGNTGFGLVFGDGSRVPASLSDSAVADWAHFDRKRTLLSAKIEHRFNERWRAQLSYGHSRINEHGGRGLVDDVGYDAQSPMNMFSSSYNYQPYRINELAGKLEGQYPLFGHLNDVVVGFNTASHANWASGSSAEASTVPFSQWNGHVPLILSDSAWHRLDKAEQAGVFASTRLRPTETLSVILGGRWSHWETRSEHLPDSSWYNPSSPVIDDRKYKGIFTPYAGVVYDLSKNLSAYASYTEIFKPQYSKDAGGRLLDPEQGKNYELGLKGTGLDGKLNASAAVFEVRKDNLAVTDGSNRTPDGEQAFVAKDNTKGRGWELEVAGELAPGWQMQAGYTRMLTRDSGGSRITADFPVHMFKLFTSYSPRAVPGLMLGGGVVWQSKIYDSSVDDALLPIYTQNGYAVVNLMAHYAFNKHWSLTANLNNVFDKRYRTDTSEHVYGAPRNLYATLKYQF